MKQGKWRGVLAASCVTILSACGVQDKANDMIKTSKEISGDSKHLAKRTDDLEAELSKKESFSEFDKKTDDLFGEKLDFTNVNSWTKNPEPDLSVDATAAMESLPFQLWKGDYNEDYPELDLRFQFSADAFFAKTLKHIPSSLPVDGVLSNWFTNRSYKGVASLGAMLGDLSDGYVRNTQRAGVTAISFYDVIITALKNRNNMDRKEQLPKACDMIRFYRRQAIYMLQLRHNYLPLMVLSRFSYFADGWSVERLWMRYMGTTIDLTEFGVTDSELKKWTTWLNQASETRKALREMGIPPEYNTMFAGIVSGVKFAGQKELLARPRESLSPLEKLEADFMLAWTQVVIESRPVEAQPRHPDAVHVGMEPADAGKSL